MDATTPLFRCHDDHASATSFNPHYGGGGRFHFFDSAGGSQVAVLYAGATKECALFESVFHNVPLHNRRTLLGKRLIGHQLSELRLETPDPLRLVELHDPGLFRLGLRPSNLTATPAAHYLRTRTWAARIHQDVPWVQGLVWMSARRNCDRAVVLFEDRLGTAHLRLKGRPFRIDDAPGITYVKEVGRSADIDVTWPTSVPQLPPPASPPSCSGL